MPRAHCKGYPPGETLALPCLKPKIQTLNHSYTLIHPLALIYTVFHQWRRKRHLRGAALFIGGIHHNREALLRTQPVLQGVYEQPCAGTANTPLSSHWYGCGHKKALPRQSQCQP